MTQLDVFNPFSAAVYHEDIVGSTMDISHSLALQGEAHGTVITADFQEAGRGRIRDRNWHSQNGENLLFTILLRYPRIEEIPSALTLKAGLAVALAIGDFMPDLAGRVKLKWPNDVMITFSGKFSHNGTSYLRYVDTKDTEFIKKVCGIYTEAEGGIVHLGIGVNFGQKEFPESIQNKATSISLASGMEIAKSQRFILLEKILLRLHELIEKKETQQNRQMQINNMLFKKGEQISFAEGAVGSGKIVNGILDGIGPGGELLIIPDGEKEARAFVTGELV